MNESSHFFVKEGFGYRTRPMSVVKGGALRKTLGKHCVKRNPLIIIQGGLLENKADYFMNKMQRDLRCKTQDVW